MFYLVDATGEKEYRVEFHYPREDLETTICEIKVGPIGSLNIDKALEATAKVTRYIGDNPNRNAARKAAMVKALHVAGYDASIRKTFWDAMKEKRGTLDNRRPRTVIRNA